MKLLKSIFLIYGPHPAIVVSSDVILANEGFFYAILMSTKNRFPDFNFEILPQMLNNPRNSRSGYALCHQMHLFYEDEIISRTGSSLKNEYFKEVIKKVNDVIFDIRY